MNSKSGPYLIIGIILTIITILGLLSGCVNRRAEYEEYIEPTSEEYAQMTPEERVYDIVKRLHALVTNRECDDLNITIYCLSPKIIDLHYYPGRSVEELIEMCEAEDGEYGKFCYCVDVGKEEIKRNLKWLEKINVDAIKPVQNPDTINARFYYKIKVDDEVLIEVLLFGYVKEEVVRERTWEDSILSKLYDYSKIKKKSRSDNWNNDGLYYKLNRCILINGIPVDMNDCFLKAIMPFVPEDVMNALYEIYS